MRPFRLGKRRRVRGGLLHSALATASLCGAATVCGNETPGADRIVDNACVQRRAGGVVHDAGMPGETGAPEIATGFATKKTAYAGSYMVVANNPLAAKAGCDMLKARGSAVDAAIAVQMVLNLVEPQSSGIGGGAFMLHYDNSTQTITAYDGRETAPAAATENYLRWISDSQRTPPLPGARASGRSIGTPGVLHMLDAAYQDAGRLPWKDLFAPAIQIANEGFRISPRLHASIDGTFTKDTPRVSPLQRDPQARAYFLTADGSAAKPENTLLRSPALAATFAAIADHGISAFYGGRIAQDIVDEVADTTGDITPGVTTLADLAGYRSVQRQPVCTQYRIWWVCGMPPPTSGGIAIAQVLGILENHDLSPLGPTALDQNGGKPTALGVHLIAEAERLAYADRDKYVADTDFVPLPGGSPARMLDKAYLRDRSSLIKPTRSMGTAAPGDMGAAGGLAAPGTENGTTHVTVVDGRGNVVTLTSSVESAFGSYHMTRGGFLLNNQLTDFSAAPSDAQGMPIANRVAGGKRPRSSMSPTLVFRTAPGGQRGEFHMATGSPGGGAIIQYVVKTLVGVLDWGLDAQQATSMVNFGATNTAITNIGGEHPNLQLGADNGAGDALIAGLRKLGHTVSTAQQSSGLSTIVKRSGPSGHAHYEGGADPRREGVVLGDLNRD